jgi:hypothetical protein
MASAFLSNRKIGPKTVPIYAEFRSTLMFRMPRTFHFQYLGEVGWESIGAGLGSGCDPVKEALEEVRRLSDGKLPAGHYQVIEARVADPRWETFDLGEDGQPVDEQPFLDQLRQYLANAPERYRLMSLQEARLHAFEDSEDARGRAEAARATSRRIRDELFHRTG